MLSVPEWYEAGKVYNDSPGAIPFSEAGGRFWALTLLVMFSTCLSCWLIQGWKGLHVKWLCEEEGGPHGSWPAVRSHCVC